MSTTFGLQPGWDVALALREPMAGLRCYVGKVMQVDDDGVRVTLIDWIVGAAASWDLYVPWSNVLGALVATDEHASELFGKEAADFQTRHNEATAPSESP